MLSVPLAALECSARVIIRSWSRSRCAGTGEPLNKCTYETIQYYTCIFWVGCPDQTLQPVIGKKEKQCPLNKCTYVATYMYITQLMEWSSFKYQNTAIHLCTYVLLQEHITYARI